MAADIGFETDNQGRFTFIAPDQALGWPSALLLDQPADMLLSPSARLTASIRFRSPHRCAVGARGSIVRMARLRCSRIPRLRCSMRRASRWVCVASVSIGWTTTNSRHKSRGRIFRGQVLEYLLQRIGEEKLAPRMLNATLNSLMHALGAEGAAVIDVHADASVPTLVCQIGEPGDYVIEAAAVLIGTTSAPATAVVRCGKIDRGCQMREFLRRWCSRCGILA